MASLRASLLQIPSRSAVAWYGLLGWLIASLVIVFSFHGTVDSGDSVRHFQMAAYAFQHPELLLDHWGKPFFTLLAAAPAAFGGMIGMKIFNCLMIGIAAISATRIASRLIPDLQGWTPLFVVAAPLVFLAQFSGLTEPLFAALLGWSVAETLEGKYPKAFIAASFLPFVRTEGFLILPVFALFALVRWWHLRGQSEGADRLGGISFVQLVAWGSLLALGTVLYSFIGGLYYGEFGWVFTQNPYDTTADNYGQGDWGHFFRNYLFVVGVPLFGLFWLGWGASIVAGIQRLGNAARRPLPKLNVNGDEWLLVLGAFGAYFGAHVVFWATGMAHSMGLLRVMIALVPLSALISLRGLQLLGELVGKWPPVRLFFIYAIPLYTVVFLFTPNHASLKRHRFELTQDQLTLHELAREHADAISTAPYIYARHPYTGTAFGRDPFSETLHLRHILRDELPSGSIVLWDGWFAVKEAGISWEQMEKTAQDFVFLQEKRAVSQQGTPIRMVLYRVP